MTAAAPLAGVAVALAVVAVPELVRHRRTPRAHHSLPPPGRAGGPPRGVLERLGGRPGGVWQRLGGRPGGVWQRLGGRPGTVVQRLGARPGGVLERLGGRWRASEATARLEAAGLDPAHAPRLAAVRGGAALAGLVLAALLAPSLPARWALLTALAGPAAGLLAPDVWLRRRAQWRRRAIEAELADVLDLLRVAAAAGLSVGRALGEVGRRHPGVLAGELGRAAARLALGSPHDEVLRELERRSPADGVPALTAALARAQRLGAPLAGTLAAQAEQARARRAQRCAEAAARASPKIQLVVALLLVPSVLLLVAAALIPAFAPP